MARALSDEECDRIEEAMQWELSHSSKDKSEWKLHEGKKSRYHLRRRAMFLLGLHTGLRIGTLCAVRLAWMRGSDKKIKDEMVVPRQFLKGGRKKEGKKREDFEVSIKEVKPLIEAWINAADVELSDDDPLFYSHKTKRKRQKTEEGKEKKQSSEVKPISPHSMGNYMRALFAVLKIEDYDKKRKLGTHSIRKTLAARIMKLTKNINEVKNALDHRQISTTGKCEMTDFANNCNRPLPGVSEAKGAC